MGNEMTRVTQFVYRGDGTGHAILKPNATLHYSGDGHDHFHIERFIRTTLKPMPGNPAANQTRRGRKIGFCLVDTVKMYSNVPPNATSNPAYFGCGNVHQPARPDRHLGWLGRRVHAGARVPGDRCHWSSRRCVQDLRHRQSERPVDREGQQLRQQLVLAGAQHGRGEQPGRDYWERRHSLLASRRERLGRAFRGRDELLLVQPAVEASLREQL